MPMESLNKQHAAEAATAMKYRIDAVDAIAIDPRSVQPHSCCCPGAG